MDALVVHLAVVRLCQFHMCDPTYMHRGTHGSSLQMFLAFVGCRFCNGFTINALEIDIEAVQLVRVFEE